MIVDYKQATTLIFDIDPEFRCLQSVETGCIADILEEQISSIL
jgi:hypothetical protein